MWDGTSQTTDQWAATHRSTPVGGGRDLFRSTFHWLTGSRREVPAHVRVRLIDSVFERRAAVLFGFSAATAAALTCVFVTGARWPFMWILAEAVLFAIRYRGVPDRIGTDDAARERRHGLLVCFGLLWAMSFGLGNLGIAMTGHPLLVVMAAINTAGAAGNIASRNAPTPRFGVVVMALTIMPFGFGLATVGPPEMLIAIAMAPFWLAGMVFVLFQNHEIIVRMILAEYENRRVARTDHLTELPNRILLRERLEELCARKAKPFAALCIDLDGFKDVNDTYGHAAGDALLRAVAGRIRQAVRDIDVPCRVGGDEFVVLLPETSAPEAAFVASRILAALSRPFDIGESALVRIGASVGSAAATGGEETPQSLLDRADRALYDAKSAGRGVHRQSRTATGAGTA